MRVQVLWAAIAGAAMVYVGAYGMASAQGSGVTSYTGHLPTVSVASLRVPENAWRHLEKAQRCLLRHDAEGYEREVTKALALAPAFPEALILRASQEVLGHRFEAALADVLAAQRADPGAMWATVVMASAYNGLHRYRDARVLLDNLHGPEADTWQATYELARAHVGCHDTEESLRLSAAALDLAPRDFADVHLLRSNALLLSRRWSEALSQLEAYMASARSPSNRPDVLSAIEAVKLRIKGDEVARLSEIPAP